MEICFEGVGQVAATFRAEGNSLKPGMAVCLSDYATVSLGSSGDALCGILLGGVRGGAAAVQIGGVAKVGYSGSAPAAGWQELKCDGQGRVLVSSGGLKCLVLDVNEDEESIVIKL